MDYIIWVKNKQMLSKEEQNKVNKQNDQYARLSMGGWANGPRSHPSAIYFASVRWMPSQFTAFDGSAAPGRPQAAVTL
jgi:hypothetical protein